MAKKNQPGSKAPAPTAPTPPAEPATDQTNPASDPNRTAQERLDALTKQHEAMHKTPKGEYPL